MANADRPRGFEPVGAPQRLVKREAGSTIRKGEFVSISSDGQVDPVAAGAVIRGLAMNNAAVGEVVMVCEDKDQLYVGQADGSDIDAQTDIGNLCDVLATADDTTYETARMEIDSDTIGTGSGGQLEIIGLQVRPDNAFGAQADVVVKINEYQGQNTAAADYAGV